MHNARPSWHAKYPPHWSHRQALPRHRSRCDEIVNHTPVQNAAELRTSPGLWVPGHYEHATGWPIHTRYGVRTRHRLGLMQLQGAPESTVQHVAANACVVFVDETQVCKNAQDRKREV